MAFIGANKAVMKFEDIRVQRQMRGKVNRLVNCKAANLNKTLNASVEQIELIWYESLDINGNKKWMIWVMNDENDIPNYAIPH